MSFAKLLGGAGLLVATAIVGGTLIGSVMAAPATDEPSIAPDAHGPGLGDGEYCETFLDAFAAELGVGRDELLPASKAAAVAAIDAAVANGDLDEEQAATLKERIESADPERCGLVGLGNAFRHGYAHGFLHADVADAAAEALGLDSSEVIRQMADSASLQEIAEEQGVSFDDVKSAVMAAVQADLDVAVADGRLTEGRADAMLARIQRWLEDGGERRPPGVGRGGRH